MGDGEGVTGRFLQDRQKMIACLACLVLFGAIVTSKFLENGCRGVVQVGGEMLKFCGYAKEKGINGK